MEKMLDTLLRPAPGKNPALAGALAQAAAALARLDQALAGHPLLPAFLHRARLDAVRRQAAVDGLVIDPWHLAAVLEGFRVRMGRRAPHHRPRRHPRRRPPRARPAPVAGGTGFR
jgi:Ser/Thr protein kinase RdoA (MazF antagonist)